MTQLNVIGNSVVRPDAYDKVTGGKHYIVNYSLPGMLHGKMLRSPYPHARIVSIDTSEAERLPGVKAVITPADVAAELFYSRVFRAGPCQEHGAGFCRDERPGYAGPVSRWRLSPHQPRRLRRLRCNSSTWITRNCRPCLIRNRPCRTARRRSTAMRRIILPSHRHLILVTWKPGLPRPTIFLRVYTRPRGCIPVYMEPRVCVVDTETDGRITVHSSMQHTFGLREKLAVALGIPESRVNVVKPAYIGGGFGGKLDIGHLEPVAALLSRKARRPVRIEHTRGEDFITTTRNPIKVFLKTGVNNDGSYTGPLHQEHSGCRRPCHPRCRGHHGAWPVRDVLSMEMPEPDLGRIHRLYK